MIRVYTILDSSYFWLNCVVREFPEQEVVDSPIHPLTFLFIVLSSGGFFFFGVDGEIQYDATGGGGEECTRYLFIYTTRRHVCVDGWVVSNPGQEPLCSSN